MSSTNSNHLPEILTPVSTSNSQDNFAQSKEDFDVSSIPDSDSEGGVSIYYQTPEKEKRRGGDGFADQQMRDDEIIYGDFILDSERNDGDEGYEDNTIAWPTIISSRFSTPTTDELIKYINDTDLLGVDDDGSGEESMTTYHRKLEELARIRKIVARNLIPGTHQTAENSTSTLGKPPTLTGIQKPTPNLSLGTPLIQDFAIPLPASLPTPLPRTIFENLSAIRAPHFPHYLASQTSSLSTYPSPDIGTMYHYYGFSHRRTVNEIDILAPSDDDDDNDEEEEKDEEEQQDELCRELSEGEEGDDEGDVDLDMDMSRSTPPRPPVLGDRDQNMEDGVEIEDIDGLENGNEGYSSSSSYLSEEYDASDELGKIVSSIPAPTPPNPRDHRLGRIVNIFRTRALQRLGIPSHDSPFRLRHPVNHLVFRETGIQTADYARANAMARFERVADEFVKGERVGEGVKGGAGEDSAGDVGHLMVGTEGDERFEREEVHMRGGAGAGDF
ncbi:uncharacterized protein EAF01_000985 [Botrytis porri]|uniref:uncharacterized protein n=1 Tax=Botrytis porri TaxID=87229 RepID=UPI0019010D80|nr:uncharacterized protein EAF01_000985 [Botrytis porri]KAF7914579.1 hypothetical protein EAF01_000985 [Botrytis porri]